MRAFLSFLILLFSLTIPAQAGPVPMAIEGPQGSAHVDPQLRILLADWVQKTGRYQVQMPGGATKYKVIAYQTEVTYHGGGSGQWIMLPQLGGIRTNGSVNGWLVRPIFEVYGPKGLIFNSAQIKPAGALDQRRGDLEVTINRVGNFGGYGYGFGANQSIALGQAIASLPNPPDPEPEISVTTEANRVVVIRAATGDLSRIAFRLTATRPAGTKEDITWPPLAWHTVLPGPPQLGELRLTNNPNANDGRPYPVTITVYWDGLPVAEHRLDPQPR